MKHSDKIKHFHAFLPALVAAAAVVCLIIMPFQIDAKGGNGKGNSGGNGNNTPPADSVGTGHVVLGAPGVGLDYASVDDTPFAHVSDIGRYYKFEFTGIEVQCDADGVAGVYSYSDRMWNRPAHNNNGHGNNCDGVDSSNPGKGKGKGGDDPSGDVDDECGHMGDHDGDGTPNHSDEDYNGAKYVYGWWAMWAKVNNQQLGNLTFTSSKLNGQSSIKRMYFSTPVVFRAQDITLEWHGDGNCNDPDGHFYILGSAIKEPPVPQGELQIPQTYYQEGSTPQYGWTIERE